MKHFITFALLMLLLSSYVGNSRMKSPNYNEKYIHIYYDSKKRPHKVIIINGIEKCAMVDLDANTYDI